MKFPKCGLLNKTHREIVKKLEYFIELSIEQCIFVAHNNNEK